MLKKNKRIMHDMLSAKGFAKAFAGFYGYEYNRDVRCIRSDIGGQGAYTVIVPDETELEEFVNMVRQGEIRRTW